MGDLKFYNNELIKDVRISTTLLNPNYPFNRSTIRFSYNCNEDISDTVYLHAFIKDNRLYFNSAHDKEDGWKLYKTSKNCKVIYPYTNDIFVFCSRHTGTYYLQFDERLKLYYIGG